MISYKYYWRNKKVIDKYIKKSDIERFSIGYDRLIYGWNRNGIEAICNYSVDRGIYN